MNNPELEMDTAVCEKLVERIKWLEKKYEEQRRVDGCKYYPSQRLWGRTEGEIGGLKWVLRHYGQKKFRTI